MRPPGGRRVPASPGSGGAARGDAPGRGAGSGRALTGLRSPPPPRAAEMRGAKRRRALPAIVLLLLASAPSPPGAESGAVPAAGAERGTLLDLLLQALGDDGRPLPPRTPRRDRVISRRFSGGAPQPDPRPNAPPPRLFAAARHGEIFPRDSSLKDKFIKHFTGPVTFSSECSKHFHRLYHNTRDCSTPAYYKRCARLLTRLAMSPLCTQS
ncbi:ALK and LTK ligand 1 [Phaenicophaeus curvirostris]|uniref:ALK and LTK ligand 1 n=1 Tax=Phaenicophaeus curvirostris TaxID=33595 RepID=UPI0037F0EF43